MYYDENLCIVTVINDIIKCTPTIYDVTQFVTTLNNPTILSQTGTILICIEISVSFTISHKFTHTVLLCSVIYE